MSPMSKWMSPMGIVVAVGRNKFIAHTGRPRLEPARLIVDSVASKKPFGDQADQFAVHCQRGAVEQAVLMEYRQSK